MHLIVSVGWVGAVLAYLGLGLAAVTVSDPLTVRSAWIGMEVIGWWVLVPVAATALCTGLVISLVSPWGLFRHYWVVFSLGLTAVSFLVLLAHMPTVSATAGLARTANDAEVMTLGGDLFHPAAGLLVLVVVAVLNVYKPRGRTSFDRDTPRRSARRFSQPAARARRVDRV